MTLWPTLVFFCWGNVDDSIGTGSYQSEGNGPLCNFLWNPSNLYCFSPFFVICMTWNSITFLINWGHFLKKRNREGKNSNRIFVENNNIYVILKYYVITYKLMILLTYSQKNKKICQHNGPILSS